MSEQDFKSRLTKNANDFDSIVTDIINSMKLQDKRISNLRGVLENIAHPANGQDFHDMSIMAEIALEEDE